MPYIPLLEEGKKEIAFARTNAKFRANLRRRRANLAQRGAVRFVRLGPEHSDHHVEQMVEEFFALEQTGWNGTAGTAIASNEATRNFSLAAFREARLHRYLSLYRLECGDRLVAAHLGLARSGRYFVPQLAYDENFRTCSLGQLLVEEVVRDCVERDIVEFDSLGPTMEWKREWTALTRGHMSIYVSRNRLLGWGVANVVRAIPRLKRSVGSVQSRYPILSKVTGLRTIR